MKQKSGMTVFALLTACMLTACGSGSSVSSSKSAEQSAAEQSSKEESSVLGSSEAAADSGSQETSAQEQESAADSKAPSETDPGSDTTETTTSAPADNPHPDETEEFVLPADAYDCRTPFESGKRTAPLTGKGFVYARSGLNLREQPSATAKKIKTLPYGTELTVTELAVTGRIDNNGTRWLKVKADGKEGYVLSDYAAVSCTKPGSKMNDEERAALGILMYYQSRRITDYYIFEGGISATAMDDKNLMDHKWKKLSPKGLTVEKLMQDYANYFSMDFPYNTDEMYYEEDGWLYLEEFEGENFYIDYDELTYLTERSDNRLTYDAVGHYFTEGEFVMFTENGGILHEPFVLEYTDGVWKTAQYTPQ